MNPQLKQGRISLTGKKYTELRIAAYTRDMESCRDCGKWLPLYDENGVFNPITCAHFAHIKSRGAGGDDTLENGRTLCYECHINQEHGLKFTSAPAGIVQCACLEPLIYDMVNGRITVEPCEICLQGQYTQGYEDGSAL